MSIDKAIENAATSVEMEGYVIDNECKDWCRKLMLKEISMEDYISLVNQHAGII